MLCSWYDDVDIALSMIDTEYLKLSLICFHRNCSHLNTGNLCDIELFNIHLMLIQNIEGTKDRPNS